MKKYKIVLADPPWKYNSRVNHKTRFRGGACGHYPLMTMDEIKALPVANITADNCALFMWCTMPYIDKQLEVFGAWGFKYRTCAFTWLKTNPKSGTPFFGVGYYTKSNVELCLLGVKGRMKPVSNKVSQVVISPRREHSRKPDEIRDKIIELYGDVPRIELFAREETRGWDAIGHDIDGRNIKNILKEEQEYAKS